MEIILRKKLWNIRTPYINTNLGGQMCLIVMKIMPQKNKLFIFLKTSSVSLIQNIIFTFQL